MVFFALTRQGYEDLVRMNGRTPSPIWVNAGILSDTELSELRDAGLNVTNFTNPINAKDSEAILDALGTIQDHYSDQNIWVECVHDLL